jgi:PII-like signaling protein
MRSIDATLLRLYVHNDDRALGRPLYETVVEKARAMGLAGATVFPAELGYGSNRTVHDSLSEYTFLGAPVVIEVVDASDRIEALLAELAALIGPGVGILGTLSPVRVVRDGPPPESGAL